jgi:hypothetical protein
MRRFRPTHEPLEKRYALAASLSITGPTDAVFEGESLEYTLRLSEPSRQVETVFVSTVDGTATYGSDYFAMASQQIQFSPGQTLKKVTVRSLRDSGTPRAEGVETFSLIARPANAALGTARAIGRIADFAPPPRISVGDVSLNEGNSGRSDATFTVTLSSAAVKTVTVAYATADLSATVADTDYVATSGTLTFAPGETRKTVNVGINGDRKLESNETFSFTLSAPTNADLGTSRAFATIVNDEVDAPGFQINVVFDDGGRGPVPASVRNASQQAATRWSRIITGDLPGLVDDGVFVDDFTMIVRMGLLGGAAEGPNGVLANATPTKYRAGGNEGLPFEGITGIDPNDINASPAFLLDVLAHEMGHALGITRGAEVFSRWVSGDSFTGPNSVREFNSVFSRSGVGVPLQVGGAHWDETTFDTELMTPFISGSGNAISRVTVGMLADLGYTVNYSAAERYTPPPSSMAITVSSAGVGLATSGTTTAATTSQPRSIVTNPVATPARPQPRPATTVAAKPTPAAAPATRLAPARAAVATVAAAPSSLALMSELRRR